ncbi:NACHT domain-containing protein [Streptomyces sp. NPDC057690]|uniref:NACHT domain-containing protein n=1 Tax=Streptomyces sp. NPDC057690 TaxID=3346214 RepID=UPI0036B91812
MATGLAVVGGCCMSAYAVWLIFEGHTDAIVFWMGVGGLVAPLLFWQLRLLTHRLPSRSPTAPLLNRVRTVEFEHLRRLERVLSPGFAVGVGAVSATNPHDLPDALPDRDIDLDIAALFESLHHKRLVIVGGPGAGKTTSARRLVCRLIRTLQERRQPDDGPVPVLIGLASWDPAAQRLEDWFVLRIADHYGVHPAYAHQLVRQRSILPVLDGLDELPASRRSTGLRLLTAWLAEFPGSVLTCRSSEYDEASRLMGDVLGTTVTLLPLRAPAVTAHLGATDAERWQPVIEAIEEAPRGPEAMALSSPWFLALAMKGYEGALHRLPAELTNRATFPDAESVRQRILDTADPAADIEGWGTTGRERLALLIDAMGHESDGLLLWWRMAQKYGPQRGPLYVSGILLATAALTALAADRDTGFKALFSCMAVALLTIVTHAMGTGMPRHFQGPPRAWRPVLLGLGAGMTSLVLDLSFRDGLGGTSSFTASDFAVLGMVVLVGWILSASRSSAEPGHARPAGDLRADLQAGLAASGTTAFLFLLPLNEVSLPWYVWLSLAVAMFTATMLSTTAWTRFRLAHLSFVLDGELPLRLGRLLKEAQEQGLLTSVDGYGAGCHAFRHALVREAFVPYGPDHRAYLHTTERSWDEICEEVLGLPESIAYIAHPSDTSPTAVPGRERVAQFANEVRTHHLRTAADQSFDAYLNYLKARERMSEALQAPRWAGPTPTRSYGAAALVAGAAGYGALHLLFGPLSGKAMTGELMAFVGLLLIVVGLSKRLPRGPLGYRLSFLSLYGGTLTLYCAAPWALAPFVSPHAARTVTPISFALALAFGLIWLHARPHVAHARAALGDEPYVWPDPRHLRNHRAAAVQARQAWLTAVARNGVMPLIRDRIAVGTGTANAPLLPRIDPAQLTGSRRADQFVNTTAADEIAHHLGALKSASIGISGQRGVGKSSLMQRFCIRGPLSAADDLLVLVSAPTAYDPREFLIHLFAEVCRSLVGDDSTESDGRPGPDPVRRRALVRRASAAAAALTGLLLLLGTLLWAQLTAAAQEVTEHARVLLIAGSAALTAAGIVWALLLSLRASGPAHLQNRVEAVAAGHLRTLHYQLTFMRGRTAQLALPGGLQVSDADQLQHTRQVLTYPELVSRFRSFLDLVAGDRPRRRVVIGVDELDKLGSTQEAERFLNDIKVVFGVQGCHFLVAVSEDALTTFGRHLLDVRTAFDSAFDRVVAVRPLDLDQARTLLKLRGVWLPDPYLWLCQVLSGGLPRDLLRATTSLATERDLRDTAEMRPLMKKLIEDDAQSVLSAQTRYAATLGGAGAPSAARWIADASQAPVTADEWEALISGAPDVDPAEFDTARAVTQVRAYLALGATLLRTFTEGDVSLSLDWLRSAGPDPIHRLTTARSKLATEPEASWSAVMRYRAAVPGLGPLPR